MVEINFTIPSKLGISERKVFTQAFKDKLEKLYGDQQNALNKIFAQKDRFTFIPKIERNQIAGVCCFKSELVSEFPQLPRNYVELKSLFLFSEHFEGRGIATRLLDIVKCYAAIYSASGVLVSVNSKVTESLEFFLKHGFKTIFSISDKYSLSSEEYYLFLEGNKIKEKIWGRIINLRIKNKYLDLIKKGKKTLEGRLFSGPFRKIVPGDIVIWNGSVPTIVLDVKQYATFKAALIREDWKAMIPWATNIEEALREYESIYHGADRRRGVVILDMFHLTCKSQ